MSTVYKNLKRDFFENKADLVAQKLLGSFLIRQTNGKTYITKIVETEAYLPFIDPAAHSFIGPTKRNSVIFKDAGFSYVYHIHRYFCLNVVCDKPDIPGCVLIRAVEPISGFDLEKNITNGPGKLCRAMQITRNENGMDLTLEDSLIKICKGEEVKNENIVTTTRIGISKAKDLPLRFYIKDNPFISKKAA